MKNLLLIAGLLFTFSCSSQNHKLINAAEFKEAISKNSEQIIDVRTPDEFKAGNIKNAKNINYNAADFKEQISKLDKSKAVYVYCQAGGRSAKASKMMVDLGFKKVFELKGGYGSWKE